MAPKTSERKEYSLPANYSKEFRKRLLFKKIVSSKFNLETRFSNSRLNLAQSSKPLFDIEFNRSLENITILTEETLLKKLYDRLEQLEYQFEIEPLLTLVKRGLPPPLQPITINELEQKIFTGDIFETDVDSFSETIVSLYELSLLCVALIAIKIRKNCFFVPQLFQVIDQLDQEVQRLPYGSEKTISSYLLLRAQFELCKSSNQTNINPSLLMEKTVYVHNQIISDASSNQTQAFILISGWIAQECRLMALSLSGKVNNAENVESIWKAIESNSNDLNGIYRMVRWLPEYYQAYCILIRLKYKIFY